MEYGHTEDKGRGVQRCRWHTRNRISQTRLLHSSLIGMAELRTRMHSRKVRIHWAYICIHLQAEGKQLITILTIATRMIFNSKPRIRLSCQEEHLGTSIREGSQILRFLPRRSWSENEWLSGAGDSGGLLLASGAVVREGVDASVIDTYGSQLISLMKHGPT
jgi:hypothetical protein